VHDLHRDLRVKLTVVGKCIKRKLKAFDRRVGPDIGAAPLLDDGHLAELHSGSERSQPHAAGQFDAHHPALQKEQGIGGLPGADDALANFILAICRQFGQSSYFVRAQSGEQGLLTEMGGFLCGGEAAIPIDNLILGPFDGFIEQREAPKPLRLGRPLANRGPNRRRCLDPRQYRRDADIAEGCDFFAEQLCPRRRDVGNAPEIEN
jgi:hypothetical protein